MQGYMWSSNQHTPARYQEQPPPSYQEHHSTPYQQHVPPNYQVVTNGQPMFQAQHNQPIQQTQHYATTQARYFNGQLEATNQRSNSSDGTNQRIQQTQHYSTTQARYSIGQQEATNQRRNSSDGTNQRIQQTQHYSTTQARYSIGQQEATNQRRNSSDGTNQPIQQTQHYATTQARYSNGQQEATNQRSNSSDGTNCFAPGFQSNLHRYDQTRQQPIQPSTASNQQQLFPKKPNTYMYYSQFNQQANASSAQNCSQAPLNWTSQSNAVSSVGNNRGWTNHVSQNGSSGSMNNQQQFQPLQRAPTLYHQRQKQFGKWQKKHQSTQGHHLRISTKGRKDQTVTIQISSNSVTPPSEAHNNVTLSTCNQNQSPVSQNQPILRVNSGPDVSTTNSVGDQCQRINVGTYNLTQTPQANRGKSRFVNSIIYRLLSKNEKMQESDNIVHQKTGPQQSVVCANNRTDHTSKKHFSSQCSVEPPSKRTKHDVAQIDHWNKETNVSENRSSLGMQSSLPGTHQIGSNENRLKRTSQHTIQYSTDPADCLEAVLALQNAAHQGHKAIAIVPPITQQTLNEQTVDKTPEKADSPPLKIDSVWSLDEESDAQKIVSDSKSPSQTTQEDKSIENETESSTAKTDACCISPAECQNDAQQSSSDSSEPSFDLSSVPVTEYTLKNLTDLVKTLETAELSAGYPEPPESALDTILKLYWNGDQINIWKPLISFRKDAPHKFEGIVTNPDSVVFKSIETENLKKLADCSVLENEMYSSSEEFKSLWLNVGQPADIEKVLSKPMPEDKVAPETDNIGVTSINKGVNLPEVLTIEKSVKPNMCSPPDLFTPLAGNDQVETASENNGHSYVVASLRKRQMQNTTDQSHLNAKSSVISPLVESLTEKHTIGIFRQDDFEQMSPRDNVLVVAKTLCNSTDIKNPDKTEAPNHSSDILQVRDISDCTNPGIKGAPNNSLETLLVEEISDDENSENKEVQLESPDILEVEDGSEDEHVGDMDVLPNAISDDENSGNKDTYSDPSNKCVVKYVSIDEKSKDKENTSEIWQVEDISDDENLDTLNDPSDICVLEDVSNDKKSEDKEVSPNASEIGQVEATSDDENSDHKDTLSDSPDICVVEDVSTDSEAGDKEVSPNASEIWLVEDISDDESSDNKDTLSDSSDVHMVEDVSNDETSSDEHFLTGITVLSSEDAQTFFEHLGDESECHFQSNFDVPTEPENNKTNICCLCSSTAIATMMNNDGYCLRCWEQAPLLDVEDEPEAEAEVLGSPAKLDDDGENCSLPCLKFMEPNVSSETCIVKEGLTGQKSTLGENCPLFPELQVEKPTVALLGKSTELDQNFGPPFLEPEVKMPTVALLQKCTELDQNLEPPFLEPEVKMPTVASTEQHPKQKQICSLPCTELEVSFNPSVPSTEKCSADEVQRDCMVMSKQEQIRSSPSTELHCALPKKCTDELRVPKSDFMKKLQLMMSKTASTVQHKGQTSQKRDSMVKTTTETVTKKPNENRLNKIKFIYTKPRSTKTKLKSASPSTVYDDCVLFAPDIVVKKNCPGVPAKKCVKSQNGNVVKKIKKHRPERKENAQKVTEKVPDYSNESSVQTSQKEKITEPKKVRFDLYGSKTEELYYAKERRFSPPVTLTVSDSCSDYSDVLSAKQKVHNMWSSTFIPKTKISPSRSHQEEKLKKKKKMKPQDVLKSNMSALKRHLIHRAMLLSNGESRHYRKPVYLSKSL